MYFNPTRLTLARKCRGLSKRDLAEQAKLSDRMIYAYENGDNIPTDENVAAFSKVLHFPVVFFVGKDIEAIPVEAASFRSLSKMTAAKRDMSLSDGAIVVGLINSWLESYFSLPEVDLPNLTQDGNVTPDIAAESLRAHWGLGAAPIKNMLHLVEAKGVRVFSLPEAQRNADAFSYWHDGVRPFIFLERTKTPERCRFDIAHELGHLVLHRRETLNQGKEKQNARLLEEEANNFASAFLMPKGALMASAPKVLTIQNLIPCKHYWNVSLMALVYRLNKIGMMTEWANRTLNIKISHQYGRNRECQSLPYEQSQVITKVLNSLDEDGRAIDDIAAEIGLYPDQIEEYFFGMTITRKRPHLRLVK